MSRRLKRFRKVISEATGMRQMMWNSNPSIGWWADNDKHLVMYHGTHDSRLDSIHKEGIKAPQSGSTAGWVSMTHDPHTAHGYASMHGGEATFRNAGQKAQHVPHEHRAVVVAHIPHEWAKANMDHSFAGNMDRSKMSDKSKYEAHKASGKPDHEYYQTSELRFKNKIPAEFIKGYMKKPVKPKK